MNKISLILAATGMLTVTSLSFAQSSAVVCPSADSVICKKATESSGHLYQSASGTPEGSWTSDSLEGPCPKGDLKSTLGTATVNVDSGPSLVNCTFSGGEKPTIFHSSQPDYCLVSSDTCPSDTTMTSDSKSCVTYGNTSGCTPSSTD